MVRHSTIRKKASYSHVKKLEMKTNILIRGDIAMCSSSNHRLSLLILQGHGKKETPPMT